MNRLGLIYLRGLGLPVAIVLIIGLGLLWTYRSANNKWVNQRALYQQRKDAEEFLETTKGRYQSAVQMLKSCKESQERFVGRLTAFLDLCKQQEPPGYLGTPSITPTDSVKKVSGAKIILEARSATAIRTLRKLRKNFPYHTCQRVAVEMAETKVPVEKREDKFLKWEVILEPLEGR